MATEDVSKAIAQGQVASINYFIADMDLRTLTEIAHSPNQKVVMLPIEVMGVLGSLGGTTEIARATFGKGSRESVDAPSPDSQAQEPNNRPANVLPGRAFRP
jgi:hypothetical protein